MRGARAKALRRVARRKALEANPRKPPVEQCYQEEKRAWKAAQRRSTPKRVPRHHGALPEAEVHGGVRRLSLDEKKAAAVARGAAERAERKMLLDGDEWLAAQPWMSIERLRRVAAARRALGVNQ